MLGLQACPTMSGSINEFLLMMSSLCIVGFSEIAVIQNECKLVWGKSRPSVVPTLGESMPAALSL